MPNLGGHDNSRKLYERARKFLPGGVAYSLRYFTPHPIYVTRAKGSRVWDVDGNEYVDFWMGHGAVVTGFGYEPILEAVREQLELGTHLGWCNEWEVKWAEAVTQWFDMDLVRPTNSGTEANMYAVRLSRAYTRRVKVGKFLGGWHGGYPELHVGVNYPYDKPSSIDMQYFDTSKTVVLPYNDLDRTRAIVKEEKPAAVIVEPVVGVAGCIPAERDFLKGLRELADEEGFLLIFDEVITGFRFYKGAQHYYGVRPDLITTGKAVGGQYFAGAGAIVGRSEYMELLDQTKHPKFWERAFHGGTFVGNPLTMRAGYTLISELLKAGESFYERLDSLGRRLSDYIRDSIERSGLQGHVTGLGSMIGIHFTKELPTDPLKSEATKNVRACGALFKHMVSRGVLYTSPAKPHLFLSAAHTYEDLSKFAEEFDVFVRESRDLFAY
ncbi:MAG: aspartate aminotransferase family protein [Zestosphaera sp.]